MTLSSKAYSKLFNAINLDLATVETGLKLLTEGLPEGKAKQILRKYKAEDVVEAIKNIESLSTFEWCANKKYLKLLKREVDKPAKDAGLILAMGNISNKLVDYFQDFILRKEAMESLENANLILKNVNIL